MPAAPAGPELLQRLLHPHPVDEFFSRVWEKEPLHVTRDENPVLEDWFRELMTLDDVDRLLTTIYGAEPRALDSLRMGRDGVMIPAEEYLSSRDWAFAEVDVERVLALHRAGASIILNGVDAMLEPVAELCDAIARFAGVGVHANAYITPREAQGFPLHFDTHDVFLLQVAGEKDWKLHRSTVPLATPALQGKEDVGPLDSGTSLCLRTGEVLYIPRGLLHEGVTSAAMSVHLTIGMHPHTWAQLFRDLLAELEAEDVDFRRSVPLWRSAQAEFEDALNALTARLDDSDRAHRTADRKMDKLRARSGPSLRGLFTQIHEPERISLETIVRLREHARPEIQGNGTEVVLRFGSSVLTLPAFTRAHLDALCAGGPIRGSDLPATLDDEGKLVLLRRLAREGLLVAAADGG